MTAERVSFLTRPGSSAEILADLLALVDDNEVAPGRRDAMRAALRAARRPTVRWASPYPGDHHIEGVRHRPGLVGLDAAFASMSLPGHGVRAADFSAPDTAHPAITVRAAVQRAATYLEAYCPALAAEIRTIRVMRGDLIYRPSGRCDVVT